MSRCCLDDEVELMLSIAELGVGKESYYLAAVVAGVDEYYTEHGETAGRWTGSGISELGLSGRVESEDLSAVLAGTDPRTGERLGGTARRVPGFDLTFSPPKSVTLLWAFGDSATSADVVAAHDAAVDAAIGYLERDAVRGRRGRGGARRVDTTGLIGAAFRHRTSRAGDPQLHNHVLVANLARGVDGQWGALDSRRIFRHARTAGFLYQAQLRHELTSRLGLAWQPVGRGAAELEGIAPAAIEEFSRRRDDIEERMTARGVSGPRAAQIATLATRPAKDYEMDPASLRDEWTARAYQVGVSSQQLAYLVGRAEPTNRQPADARELSRALTADRSSFDRRDVLLALASRAASGATVVELEADAERFITGRHAVALADERCSTPEMLRLEAAVLHYAQDRRNANVGRVDPDDADTVLGDRLDLSNEQVGMVRHITSSGAGVDVVVGVAGAGKTRALGAAREVWEAAGYRVAGAALAARAASELETGSAIPSCTIDRLLLDLESPHAQLPPRTVLVIDEAGMVDTRRLAQLLAKTSAADTKVVLVGDDRQLPEIGPGGAFGSLAQRLAAATLTENRRQRDPIDRIALAELRDGNVAHAIDQFVEHGRVMVAADPGSVRAQMVSDWQIARRDGHDTVMLATRRVDVADLNQRARAALIADGSVAPTGVEIAGREFAAGDRVMTLSNRRSLGVINGARGTVRSADETGVSVEIDKGGEVQLPPSYLGARHLGYAYAMTVHKAQGMTCDHAFVLGDDALFREAGYTALSRGRLENRLYVVAVESPHDELGHGRIHASTDPIDQLVATLERSRQKSLAVDVRGALDRIRNAPDEASRRVGLDL